MRGALRTVLVVSGRPHPWAFLRDRLDSSLVTVTWWRPGQAGDMSLRPPWMVAGTGDTAPDCLAASATRLFGCLWVGPSVPMLMMRPYICAGWREVAERVARAQSACVGGVRLAPGGGLVLPGGRFLTNVAELEVLIAAHPEGLDLDHRRAAAAAGRLNRQIARHGLPLRLKRSQGRLALSVSEDFTDGRAA